MSTRMHTAAAVFAAAGLAATAMLAPADARAGATDDINIGPALTLEAPHTYRPHQAFSVGGVLTAQFALPVLVEIAHPMADQEVEVLVDGAVAAIARTDADGRWQAELVFGPEPPHTRALQAVAFRGGPLETPSRTEVVTVEQVTTALEITPDAIELTVGGTGQVRAIAHDQSGRPIDVTETATWASSDPDVATVSDEPGSKGLVTGVGPGTATITASHQGHDAPATASVA